MPFPLTVVDRFTAYLHEVYATKNPTVFPEIDLIHVLSGRTTALGNDADNMKREFDRQDDLLRIKKGIRLAKKITARRLKQSVHELTAEDYRTVGIVIFYNGRPIHNQDLKKALKTGVFSGEDWYPPDLFAIREIDPLNTIGQIKGLAKFLAEDSAIKYPVENIAVVTSGYHEIRSLLGMGADSPQVIDSDGIANILGEKRFFIYGIDKKFKREGAILDLQGEHDAMRNYVSGFQGKVSPSIADHLCRNTFFNNDQVIFEKSYNLQHRQPREQLYLESKEEEKIEENVYRGLMS